MRGFAKGVGAFVLTMAVCMGLLLAVCALIPQEIIRESCLQTDAYFQKTVNYPMLVEGAEITRMDNYADAALMGVIWHADTQHPLQSMISARYRHTDGGPIRQEFHESVAEGAEANNEYSRYWHGSQVLVRPLLTFASIEGVRAILFGLLMAMVAVLSVLLVRQKALRALLAFWAGLLLVHFWMTAFTLEYLMPFLVMTGTCIAVALLWREMGERRESRMTAICIVSGAVACFVDFLTTETLTFTVPVLLWLMLYKEHGGERLPFRRIMGLLLRWGIAWLGAYAAAFLLKWLLVWLVLGRDALMNALSVAAMRMERAIEVEGLAQPVSVSSFRQIPDMLAFNMGALFPFASSGGAWLLAGVLAVLGMVFYLFRGRDTDGAFIAALLLAGLIPYVRFMALSSHSLDHWFFTYRAQMAGVMAVFAVMTYSLNPGEVLGKKKRRKW